MCKFSSILVIKKKNPKEKDTRKLISQPKIKKKKTTQTNLKTTHIYYEETRHHEQEPAETTVNLDLWRYQLLQLSDSKNPQKYYLQICKKYT